MSVKKTKAHNATSSARVLLTGALAARGDDASLTIRSFPWWYNGYYSDRSALWDERRLECYWSMTWFTAAAFFIWNREFRLSDMLPIETLIEFVKLAFAITGWWWDCACPTSCLLGLWDTLGKLGRSKLSIGAAALCFDSSSCLSFAASLWIPATL